MESRKKEIRTVVQKTPHPLNPPIFELVSMNIKEKKNYPIFYSYKRAHKNLIQ